MRWSEGGGLAALALCVGCGAPAEDSGGAKLDFDRRLTIEAPIDGALLDEGAAARLEAEGRDATAAVVELEAPLWEVLDADGGVLWQAEGNPLTVTDLPAGRWDLRCTAGVDGVTLEDSVEVNVFAAR